MIGSFGNSGGPVYGFHQQAALAADLLLLVMGMVVELSRLVHQRHLLGRPTVLEVNDWLPGVQRCNPGNANWSEPQAWGLPSQPRRHRPGLDQLAGSPLPRAASGTATPALLLLDNTQLLALLNGLAADPGGCQAPAQNARSHVARRRRLQAIAAPGPPSAGRRSS